MYSHRGNGKLGLLCLISQGEVFNTFSDVEFVPPVNLGQHPVIPEGCTGLEAASAKKEHEDKFKEFLIYDQTDKALKSLLIAVVDEKRIRSLRHKCVCYDNVKALTILNHLCNFYARITPTDLKENDKRLKEAYDPNQKF